MLLRRITNASTIKWIRIITTIKNPAILNKISSRFEQIERVELDTLDEEGQLLTSVPAAGDSG